MEASILANEIQFARDSIFFILSEMTTRIISNNELLIFYMNIHKYYSIASEEKQIKQENMTENEKETAANFLKTLYGKFITDCGIHEPSDIYFALVPPHNCEKVMSPSMTDEEAQTARDSIFAIIDAWNAHELSNENAIQFCIEINEFYSRASDDQHIKEENMIADEKRIALEFFGYFYRMRDAEFITDCGSHDPTEIYNALVLFRCELFSQFVLLKNPPDLSLYFGCLVFEEDNFRQNFLSICESNFFERIEDEYRLTD